MADKAVLPMEMKKQREMEWARWAEEGAVFASRLPPWAAVGITVSGLAACWGIVYLLGGAGKVAPHFFYFPILFAAARPRHVGALVTAVAAAVLAGPFLPLDVDAGTPQRLSDWTSRGAFFIVIGWHMSLVANRLRSIAARELRTVREAAELAIHKAAVIQNVTHEFRTPLTVISGMASTLERPGFVSEEAKPLVASIRHACDRLSMLVEGVITTALALEKDRRILLQVQVDLQEMCRELIERLDALNAEMRVQIHIEPEAAALMTCREFLEVALRSIIENALKFSPTDTPVEIHARRRNGVMELRVRDRGPGISPEFYNKAFEPFTQQDETTTRAQQGLGLGLFATKAVTERLGGTISVEQAPGGGTDFVITLPQQREEDQEVRSSV